LAVFNETLQSKYGSKSDANRLVKRVLETVDQDNVATFLSGKTESNELVSTHDNPSTNKIYLIYTSKSFLIFVPCRLLSTLRNLNIGRCLCMLVEDGGGSTDYTFTVLRKFSDFTNGNVLEIGTGGLEGCTVLTIVSPVAVYMVSNRLRLSCSCKEI
jgi:hypothetical protein